MKRVMFVCLALKSGGAERVVNILANEFLNRDYDVTILAFSDSADSYGLDERIHLELHSLFKYNAVVKKIKRITTIRKLIKEKQIDLVIAFSYYINMSAIIAKFGLNTKVVISERNDPAQEDSRPLLKYSRDILYRAANLLVCQTEDAKDYFPKAVQKKTVVIMNPLTDKLPNPYFGVREKKIVCFARLHKQKNLPLLIQAFAQVHRKHPEYKLKIYGNGEEKEHLLQLIHNLKLEDAASIYPFSDNIHSDILQANMFVLPSDYEGLSNSMLEAMALGIPTVCTDCPCGGARMVIQDHVNGMLVPVGDCDGLVKAINELIENEVLARKLSERSVEIRKRLNSSAICGEWIEAIDSYTAYN